MVILTGVNWYLTMALIHISLTASDAEHPFIYLCALCKSSLEKCLFRYFAYFLIGLFVFLEWSRVSSFFFLKILFIYLFILESRGEREREGEKHQCVVASWAPPTGGLACNPCMCIDWESNWWPFSSQAGTQSTKPHQPGRPSSLYILEPNSCLRYHLQIYFPLYWFPFHFAIFFSCAEAFYFDDVLFVYSFLYVPCSREYIGEYIAARNIWDFPTNVLP